MLVPIIKKININTNVLIERSLPVSGVIHVNPGETIKPFDRVGDCNYSHKRFLLPNTFKPKKPRVEREFYYMGESIGKVRSKNITAPFNGFLEQTPDNAYVYREVENKYILLSGLWGQVKKVIQGRSALIQTQCSDLMLIACTKKSFTGELVVFPNPDDLLKVDYLEKFLKDPVGKIIYLGDFADEKTLSIAYKLGVSCVIAGSCDREAFKFAKEHDLGFGIINGFGKIITPEAIFKFLNQVSHRQVFFQGERNLLRVPMPEEDLQEDDKISKANPLKKLSEGDTVQVFQKPYFGKVGTVDSISEFSIVVKFGNEKDTAEIAVPNFFVLE